MYGRGFMLGRHVGSGVGKYIARESKIEQQTVQLFYEDDSLYYISMRFSNDGNEQLCKISASYTHKIFLGKTTNCIFNFSRPLIQELPFLLKTFLILKFSEFVIINIFFIL